MNGRRKVLKTELTEYEKFKIYLITNNLDVELAEPVRFAPSILSHPWDDLCVMLSMLGKDFRNKSTTILVKPLFYNAVKYQAGQENMYINEYINHLFASSCESVVRREIEIRIKNLALRMEVFGDS